MPVPALAAAASVRLLGARAAAEAVPSAICAVLLALCGYAAGVRLVGRRLAGVAVACACILDEAVMKYATDAESAVPYATLLGGAVLLLDFAATAGDARARRWLATAAGASAALAVLTRGDAALVVAVAAVLLYVAARASDGRRLGAATWACAAAGGAAVLAPWVVRSVIVFHAPWNPSASRALWLVRYEDLFVYPSPVGAARWFAHLRRAPGEVLGAKWDMVKSLFGQPGAVLGHAAMRPLVALGAVCAVRDRRALAVGALGVWAGLLVAYGLVADLVGQFSAPRSLVALVPFAAAAALRGLVAVAEFAARAKEDRRRRARTIVGAIAASVGVVAAALAFRDQLRQPAHPPEQVADAQAWTDLAAALDRHAVPHDEPVMLDRPWQLTYVSGRPTLMMPTNGPAGVCAAAARYGARALVMEDYGYPGEMGPLFRGTPDPRFPLLEAAGRFQLRAIRCDATARLTPAN
jgi:4-amino-4-deoxy-L-arabinose transferase-like glycosyltransferase